ncbi:hypothetical protein [Silvibacterium acidisoli]
MKIESTNAAFASKQSNAVFTSVKIGLNLDGADTQSASSGYVANA